MAKSPAATKSRPAAPAARAAKASTATRPAAGRPAGSRRLGGKPALRLPAKAPRPKGGARGAAEGPPEKAPKAPPAPQLKEALGKLAQNAKKLKKHDPAADKAAEAHAAAVQPEKERMGLAQEGRVEELKRAEGKPPEEKSFLEVLEEEIEKVMPKTIEDTDSFMGEEDKKKFKGGVTGNIESQKQAATGEMKEAARTPPDTTGIPEKPVTGLPPEALPPPTLAPVGARDAMPDPRPEEEVSLQPSKDEAERQFADNKITPGQLRKANDKRFTAVLQAKEAVDAHADAAPAQYREDERKTLVTAASRAASAERRDVAAMKGARGDEGAKVKSKQELARERDEARRRKVGEDIEAIYEETKKAVEDKLATLEGEVSKMFDEGLEAAIKDMKKETNAKKNKWKKDRYGSAPFFDFVTWGYDKLAGIEDHPRIKQIYVEAAEEFTRDMKALVRSIARHVETRLKEARDEVEKGRLKIKHYVDCLPEDLKKVGEEAAASVSERFDELKQGIEDKKRDLAQSLAQRYKEAHDKAGEAIKEMQAEDKGLVEAFLDKLAEIVEILSNFRRRIMSMLRKAADAIDLIVADPIGFLKNLLSAIKRGVGQFVGRIWEHLKAGFMAWLFGSLAAMGVRVPKDFSLPSILQLVLDVLGLTPERIKAKVVKVIGERNAALLEAAWEAVELLVKGGPAALWERIREHFANLREMVVDAMQEWLISAVIRSATTKLAMMFNPVGAIIQAIIMIYNTVMFFIENIDRILSFVEAIIESVYNIATGAVGAAADWIEKALARTIPVIIAFLARLLGLTGLADKIKGFILRIQTRIEKAIDKVIEKIVGGIKRLIGAGKAAVAGIVEWWRAKVSFTADDGESHTLFFDGTGESAQLMIASHKRSYADFIKGVKVPSDDDDLKKLKAAALKEAKEIDDLKKRQVDPKKGKIQDQKIRTHINNLAGHTKKLAAAMPDDPPSVVEYGGLTADGGGTWMKATVLSRKNRAGSRPQDKPTIWLKARRRTNDFYVQGHLLNEDLGGPGRAYNLTPISNHDANTKHYSNVESKIKPLVLRSPYQVIRYHVIAVYGKHPKRAFKTTLEQKIKDLKKAIPKYKLPKDKNALARDKRELTKAEKKFEIMDYEEKKLVRRFETSWWRLKHNGSNWVVDKKHKKETKDIANDLPDGDFKYQE
jgi:DNA/RNA non-specific endonuclease